MRVELLSYTPDALNLLLRTKGTRLGHDEDVSSWSPERKQEHLDYMRDTIKSSWEFVDYTFAIEGVTRAFTHQLVRTRSGSYAQESQRTVDVRNHSVITPDSVIEGDLSNVGVWSRSETTSLNAYADMIDHGVPVQDARGILPTAISTSIVAKFNLRTLSDMARVRLCTRTQGEYQRVFRAMRSAVLVVHPWAEPFIEVACVASGTCAFPRYGQTSCKFYDPRMDLSALKEETRLKFWSSEELQIANPVAKDGRTM